MKNPQTDRPVQARDFCIGEYFYVSRKGCDYPIRVFKIQGGKHVVVASRMKKYKLGRFIEIDPKENAYIFVG